MRIPCDKRYTDLLGQAVYAFAYYEWTIIHIIEHFQEGFVHIYSRKEKMTSGIVSKRFSKIEVIGHPLELEIVKCRKDFEDLLERRNTLIHAHPCTARDGAQILNYQTVPKSIYHDVQWPEEEIEDFISAIDLAESQAGGLLEKLRAKHENDSSERLLKIPG